VSLPRWDRRRRWRLSGSLQISAVMGVPRTEQNWSGGHRWVQREKLSGAGLDGDELILVCLGTECGGLCD
jgi:hypothetical protein